MKAPTDHRAQKTYYQTGVGTSAPAGSTFFRWYAIPTSTLNMLTWQTLKAFDLMFGGSVGMHVQNAYRWACDNYEEGDKISVIGFSRGAYTARILAAMILSIGECIPSFLSRNVIIAGPASNRSSSVLRRRSAGTGHARGHSESIRCVPGHQTVP